MDSRQIKHMVDRFLTWKLPADFAPNGGINLDLRYADQSVEELAPWPVGTNLLTATQAAEMIRHLAAGLPDPEGGFSRVEAIEMMNRCAIEIDDLRRTIERLRPKADAYDRMSQVLDLLPRSTQGYSEDLANRLRKRIGELQSRPNPVSTDNPVSEAA